MRRGTKLFLLAGCALILVLETPAAIAALADGWVGPYGAARTDLRTAEAVGNRPALAAAQPMRLELARR
jgi:hypothetical protein